MARLSSTLPLPKRLTATPIFPAFGIFAALLAVADQVVQEAVPAVQKAKLQNYPLALLPMPRLRILVPDSKKACRCCLGPRIS